jgi:hypothetical protein
MLCFEHKSADFYLCCIIMQKTVTLITLYEMASGMPVYCALSNRQDYIMIAIITFSEFWFIFD